MQRNLLLGIGGSGSRIVESCLAHFAAGLGPRDGIHIGLLDQDGQNGNAGRTQSLFRALSKVQRKIGTGPGAFPGVAVTSFREDQFFYSGPPDIIWKPDVDDRPLADLLNITNETDAERLLFEHLYERDESTKPLPIGFEGHANVGAAAIYAALMDPDGEVNARLRWFIEQAEVNQPLRIFLAGSIFGGMGASGFPTIARRIRQLQTNEQNESIRIGGVLMLPYFNFKDSDEDEFALKRAEILQNARQAVEFYGDLLENEPGIFDRFYLAGWNDAFELDYWNPGGSEQKNPPMPPELYAASAALDFFAEPPDVAGPRPPGQALAIRICGREDEDRLSWEDLPGAAQIRPALGRLLRLAAYWRFSIDPAARSAKPIPAEWRRMLGPVDKAAVAQLNELVSESGLFDFLLRWAGAMRLFASTDGGLDFQMWTADCVDGDPGKPGDGVSLKLQELPVRPLFDTMMAGSARDACDLYAEINRRGAAMRGSEPPGVAALVRVTDLAARLSD